MQAMRFYSNNFDRADFINSFVTDSNFENCFFGSDFINTIFKKTSFDANRLDTCTITNCEFIECYFHNEYINNTTNRKASYTSCSFENCKLEMNTFEDITFRGCSFMNLSFAEMGAYNFTFDQCNFSDLTIDPDYFGTYLFKNSPLSGLKYLYRGNEIALNGNIVDDFGTLSLFYLKNERYYEALNMFLLHRHHSQSKHSIVPFFTEAITHLKNLQHPVDKKNQLDYIVRIFLFYLNSEILTAIECYHCIGILEQIDPGFRDIAERINFLNQIDLLKKNLELSFFSDLKLNQEECQELIYCEITIDEPDYVIFEKEFNNFFSDILREYELPLPAYHILGIRKGSIIIEVLGYAIGLYVLTAILKSTFAKALEIVTEVKIFEKTKQLLDSDLEDLKNWEQSVNTARNIMRKPSNEILQKGHSLTKLLKQFHVFPNTIFKKS